MEKREGERNKGKRTRGTDGGRMREEGRNRESRERRRDRDRMGERWKKRKKGGSGWRRPLPLAEREKKIGSERERKKK